MRWLGVALSVLATDCTETTVVGIETESVASGVVVGTVTDAEGAPVDGATVGALGPLQLHCASEIRPVGQPSETTTDIDGSFALVLATTAPSGQHCVDLVVTHSGSTVADTFPALPISFRDAPGDTTTVALQVTW